MNRRQREKAERERTQRAATRRLAALHKQQDSEVIERIKSIPDDMWRAAEEEDAKKAAEKSKD